ncbi:unnamed protein product, partial [Sphacelaria rigidula]
MAAQRHRFICFPIFFFFADCFCFVHLKYIYPVTTGGCLGDQAVCDSQPINELNQVTGQGERCAIVTHVRTMKTPIFDDNPSYPLHPVHHSHQGRKLPHPVRAQEPHRLVSTRLPRRLSPPSHCRSSDDQSRLETKQSADAAIPSGSPGASISNATATTPAATATAKKSTESETRGGAGVSAATTSVSSASKPVAKQVGTGKAPGGDVDEREVEGVPNETLFVGNLSYKVSEAVIIKLFTPFGKVVREQFCYHMTGPRRGEPRGFCFVEYSNAEDAGKAIRALHGRKLYGRPLRVRFMTVEGHGRMDYSTSDKSKSGASTGRYEDNSGGAKIPSANATGGGAGAAAAAGVTKLSIDKKVCM